MITYAVQTSVPVERSQREIEQLVTRYGAKRFFRGFEDGRAVVGFEMGGRRVQFDLPLPRAEEFATYERRGRQVKSTPAQVEAMLLQAERAKWRALCLTVKAKLVSVEAGVETLEEAFLAQILVPSDGRSVRFGELAIKAITEAYRGGTMPPLLPAGSPQS